MSLIKEADRATEKHLGALRKELDPLCKKRIKRFMDYWEKACPDREIRFFWGTSPFIRVAVHKKDSLILSGDDPKYFRSCRFSRGRFRAWKEVNGLLRDICEMTNFCQYYRPRDFAWRHDSKEWQIPLDVEVSHG
jgi:hypothetical protein